MNAMDLALYKSEWQIRRSDNFLAQDDPGPTNDSLPHSTAFASDDEHRYREGMCLAYWLSGRRTHPRGALRRGRDPADRGPVAQERGMYQTIRAMAAVATFTALRAPARPGAAQAGCSTSRRP